MIEGKHLKIEVQELQWRLEAVQNEYNCWLESSQRAVEKVHTKDAGSYYDMAEMDRVRYERECESLYIWLRTLYDNAYHQDMLRHIPDMHESE